MTQEEIDALIQSGSVEEEESGAAPEPSPSEGAETSAAEPEQFDPVPVSDADFPSFDSLDAAGDGGISPLDPKIELLYDLQLPVTIELGRTNMLIRDILRLSRGSVVEFDKLASEPVDLLVNGKKIAEGEVVVIDKHFGIRVTSLLDPAERIRASKR